ncbi:ECF transporter S component [Neobacillus drentensis]|uniref:ECF transporter S component n=1 Tax=Neobacillus drentensis TaxID=220684 RepID=UPI001F2AB783|nr:ECF transporter S component [Neobacillus drentensis]ULT58790.1 ECF transporter S component [Neobacillus drentensis]
MKGKTISLLGLMIALSAVGASIKIPAVIDSVALDALPALLAAALLGVRAGAITGALGHLFSALIGGFPLGPMHLLIAVEMAALVWSFGILYKQNKRILASLVFIVGNAFIAPVPFIFLMNKGFYFAIVPSLLIGSFLNTVLAVILIPRLSSLTQQVLKKRDAH